MKKLLCLLLLAFSFSAFAQTAVNAKMNDGQSAKRNMAAEGDKVWIIINQVKSNKKADFEKFVNEVFWPMSAKLDQKDQQVFKQTRVLYPLKPEADGSYIYLFVMDPYIDGGDYDIESLLTKMYGPDKAKEYNKAFEGTLVKEQTQYMMVQSKN